MPNRMKDVERIEKAMHKGWPEGTSELHREIPVLLDRIKELENALVPFARVWIVEKNNPNAHSEFLVNVYLKHCKHAFDKIDVNQAVKPKEDDFFSLPAEG